MPIWGTTLQEISVEVRPDFLERQTKAQPVHALAELIWNALDADATSVDVDFDYDGIGGMSKIVVTDNGHGIAHTVAPQLFKNLGGSWKRQWNGTLRTARNIHAYWRARRAPQEKPRQPIHKAPIPGRNDPCPCGSGKKFKHCHGAPDTLH